MLKAHFAELAVEAGDTNNGNLDSDEIARLLDNYS